MRTFETARAAPFAATSAFDGDTMTLTPESALADGEYEVQWTSIAADGDILRGTFLFTVATPASPEPTSRPLRPRRVRAQARASSSSPSPSAVPSPSLAPSPAIDGRPIPERDRRLRRCRLESATSSSPSCSARLLIAGLAVLLLRRRDSSSTIP